MKVVYVRPLSCQGVNVERDLLLGNNYYEDGENLSLLAVYAYSMGTRAYIEVQGMHQRKHSVHSLRKIAGEEKSDSLYFREGEKNARILKFMKKMRKLNGSK